MPRFSVFKSRIVEAANRRIGAEIVTAANVATNVTDLIDSAYISAKVPTIDSADVTSIIDANYIASVVPSIDSADVTSIIDASYIESLGVSGGGSQQKTYSYIGPLQEHVSTERLYIGEASTLSKILTVVGSTGNTSAQIKVKKNGTVINTITIPADTFTVSTTTNTALAEGDYLTVDITGSSSAKDLYVTLIYGA